jgi:hypothetical protein
MRTGVERAAYDETNSRLLKTYTMAFSEENIKQRLDENSTMEWYDGFIQRDNFKINLKCKTW